jgi:antitoxin ChpS
MELTVRKWGNSAGMLIPTEMLAQLNAKMGDKLRVDFVDHKAVIELAKPKYSLSALLAQCDLAAPMPADLKDWQNIPLVGNEI